jgi:hypothetical protein
MRVGFVLGNAQLHQISELLPHKLVDPRCASVPTLESVGNGFAVHGQLTSGSGWASYGVSVRRERSFGLSRLEWQGKA